MEHFCSVCYVLFCLYYLSSSKCSGEWRWTNVKAVCQSVKNRKEKKNIVEKKRKKMCYELVSLNINLLIDNVSFYDLWANHKVFGLRAAISDDDLCLWHLSCSSILDLWLLLANGWLQDNEMDKWDTTFINIITTISISTLSNLWLTAVFPAGCGGPVTAPSGEIHSPLYPNSYPNNVDCSWVISVDPNHRVLLNFSDLDIEYHSNCSWDYVAVSDWFIKT